MTHSKTLTVRAHSGAALRIQGTGLNMEGLRRALGREPTHAHRKGEPAPLKQAYELDMWLLDSPLERIDPLQAHLIWLYEALTPCQDFLRTIRGKSKIDIYCYQTCYTEQASITLSPKALTLFTELEIPLEVSLLFIPEETSEQEPTTETACG